MRFQNYFEHNGKQYFTGTVLIVHWVGGPQKATFLCYDTERKMYVYKVHDCKCHKYEHGFRDSIIEITDEVNNKVKTPEVKTKHDGAIDGLALGWFLYIFMMIISTIFNDRIMMWAIWTVIFLVYRNTKIEEEGKYVEW